MLWWNTINNILPEQDRFYNRNIEIPDYDFFSPNTRYLKNYDVIIKMVMKVEAKAEIHSGT